MNDDAPAFTRQGIALFQQGRLTEALACFQEFVRLEPQDAHGYNNVGNVFLYLGRYDDAIANYRHAIELLPSEAGFYSHLSYAYSKQGSGGEAEQFARHALWLKPNFPDAHNHLGIALGIQERYDESESCYLEALRLAPNFAQAYSNLAQLHILQHRHDDAFARAQRAIELDPRLAEAHASLSAVYIRQNNLDEALASCRRALELHPQLPQAHLHEATVYLKQGQLAEAVHTCREVLRSKPDYIDMEYVLGMAALKENRLEDALGSFNRLLEKKPKEAQVHFNRALIWLLQGNYEQGWPEYEWRWRWPEFVVRPFTQPVWDGAPLDGKTILLHSEQGLGDTLQFIRYAPLVKQRGGKVIVACQEVLLKLLSRCAGIDELVPQETFTGQTDEHAPLLSLPSIFKTTVTTIPAQVPYVFPDAALVDQWRGELTRWPGFKVGIAWQGSPKHPDDRFRSIPLPQFAPLGQVQGTQWFSLQKGPGEEQLAAAPFAVVDLSSRLDETTGAFMDTAAVMKSLDLVITADTATAHLAGALGVPVWVALHFAPDFRWFLEREDSPWYPSMRLFRQSRRGQWQDVFERMAEELRPVVRGE